MPKTKSGTCVFCLRDTALTFHHLIPRKVHRRAHFKKHYDRASLNQGVDICQTCHRGIHRRYDEMHLAKSLSSVELILADRELKKFFQWVAKQRVQ